MTNLTQHPCSDKCSDFKGEQCGHCLIQQQEYMVGDTVVFKDADMHDSLMIVSSINVDSVFMDDDAKFALSHLLRHATVAEIQAKRRLNHFTEHTQSHISPPCNQDALNRMESHYIEQKKQVELLKTEKLAMQAEIDLLKEALSTKESLNDALRVRFNELSESRLKFDKQITGVLEIINDPNNYYMPFYCVAEQIQAVLGEAQGEVA